MHAHRHVGSQTHTYTYMHSSRHVYTCTYTARSQGHVPACTHTYTRVDTFTQHPDSHQAQVQILGAILPKETDFHDSFPLISFPLFLNPVWEEVKRLSCATCPSITGSHTPHGQICLEDGHQQRVKDTRQPVTPLRQSYPLYQGWPILYLEI